MTPSPAGAALLLALLGLVALCGCDYPEGGYYELDGIDSQGHAVIAHPFMVEEETDDTSLTTGFRILLPGHAKGTLVEAELVNSADFSRRGWHLALADADTLSGDIDLDLESIDLESGDSRIDYSGLYRRQESAKPENVGGFIAPDDANGVARVVSTGDLPKMPSGYPRVERYEMRVISKEQFEARLGGPLDKAKRMTALVPKGLGTPKAVKKAKGESKPSHEAGGQP